MPGRKYDTYFDPEGFLSNLPAIVTCVFGVFAGLLLRSAKYLDQQKVDLPGGGGSGGGYAWLGVECSVSGSEENLDIFLRFGGWWLQRVVARGVLYRGRYLEIPMVVPTVYLDGNESYYDLSDEQRYRRFSHPGETVCWR